MIAARPRSQILYLYGGFARRMGGWVAVSTLVDLMAILGIESPTVRAAVSRMKRRRLLTSSRRGGVAGYALTPSAWQILEEGDRRILTAREPSRLEDGWILVVFSVPESQRSKRHQIRRQLSWLGFGTVASGVWIAPKRLRPEVESTLTRQRLIRYSEIFEASYGSVDASRKLARKCWDLKGLSLMYRQFASRWEPALERWFNGSGTSSESAFRDYIGMIADWRRLPFLDPGLPAEVLPDGWEGERAKWIYFALMGRIDAPALQYVKSRAATHGTIPAR